MEDIVLSIVPVWETCLVARGLHDWLGWSNHFFVFGQSLFCWLSFVVCFVCSRQIHFMRVDDLCLFLKVESRFVVFDLCLSQFSIVILSVVGEESLWIWVSDESVSASCHP